MERKPIKLYGRYVKPHKATVSSEFGSRTVLTNSPWEYVSLWLQRNGFSNALFYWSQARSFATASLNLSPESAPLLHYYTFMNATKALLVAKGVAFKELHGVSKHNMREPRQRIDLDNEGVRIHQKGVLPALSVHLQEQESVDTHSMKELLFNIPCIHRTFCITYPEQMEMYIPLTNCQYVFDSETESAYLTARISDDFDHLKFLPHLPVELKLDSKGDSDRCVRSASEVSVSGSEINSSKDIDAIAQLNKKFRVDLHYIAGGQTLWYAKAKDVSGTKRLLRSPLTLTLAAMHRLSELSRYHPMELSEFFKGPQNWLLSEFIRMAPQQFLDEISAEITGHQCMTPNVRPAI